MIYLIGRTKEHFTYVLKKLRNKCGNNDTHHHQEKEENDGQHKIYDTYINTTHAKIEYMYEILNHTLASLYLSPYVLTIQDFFHVGDAYYIIYPRAHNTLYHLLNTNLIDNIQKTTMFSYLQTIFERMIQLQIYHNDLKAENILYNIKEINSKKEKIYEMYIHDWGSATILLSDENRELIIHKVPQLCFILSNPVLQKKYMIYMDQMNCIFLKDTNISYSERFMAGFIGEYIALYADNIPKFLRFIMLLSICMLLDSSDHSQRFFRTCTTFPEIVNIYKNIYTVVHTHKLTFYEGWTHIFIAHQRFMHKYALRSIKKRNKKQIT
jgi:hypothetical protein